MAIVKPQGLKFPKIDFKRKINGRTNFTSTTETFTLSGTALWDGLHGAQLDHLPARIEDAIGQTITNPTVTVAGNARIVRFKSPDLTEPTVGEVYIDLYTGIINFNAADAGLAVSVTYYIRADLIDHNAMNRIHQAGHTYIVGDEQWADYSDLQLCFNACVDGDSVKLMKDVQTSGLTLTKKIVLQGNKKKIIKTGSASGGKGINFSADVIIRDLEFSGWTDPADICLYASADVIAIITTNNSLSNTKLTNVGTVCTYGIVENNLPFSENIGQSVTNYNISYSDQLIRAYTNTATYSYYSVSVGDPLFLNPSNPNEVTKSFSLNDNSIFVGFAMANAAPGAVVPVIFRGFASCFTGLVPGQKYYIDFSGGLHTFTEGQIPTMQMYGGYGNYTWHTGSSGNPSMFVELGIAANSTTLVLVNPKRCNFKAYLDCQFTTGLALNPTIGTDPINSIDISAVTPTPVYSNIFCDSGGTAINIDTGSIGWELEIDYLISLEALSGTVIPELKISLQQQFPSPSSVYSDLDMFNFYGYIKKVLPDTTNGWGDLEYYRITVKFSNPNPIRGRHCRIAYTATHSTTGLWKIMPLKARINFL